MTRLSIYSISHCLLLYRPCETYPGRGSFKARLLPSQVAALRMELSLPDGRAYVGQTPSDRQGRVVVRRPECAMPTVALPRMDL